MKKQLEPQEKERMLKLLNECKLRKENNIASMIQLAITMSDKGEYDKFIEVFSDNN